MAPDDSNPQPTDISPLPGSPIEDSHRQELFRIASDPSLTTDEKLERLLSVGATVLDVQNAHVVAIDGDDHEIIATSDPTIATTGTEHELAETFCQETVTSHQVVTDLGREDVTGISPDFDEIGYYIGSKVLVNSERYGTVCFVDTEPRNRDLNAAERSFVDLASRWVSLILEESRQDRLQERDLDAYQLLVEEVTDYAIVMLETTGDIKSWNTGAHLLHQYQEDEVIGEHISLFYTAEDRHADLPDELLETARQNGRVEREGWRVKKDGSRFWALVTITALYDQNNALRGFGMITRNLTERKAQQEKRERDIEFTEEALDTLNDVFFVLDASGQIDRINEELAAVSGYSEAELISMDPVELFVPEDRERIANAIDTALGSGETQIEATLQSKTNERRRFEIQARRLLDSDGSIQGIVGIGRDITARELNEERLQVAQRVLRHNLRNDLNAIQGWTEILRRDDETHRDEAISRILHTTDRLMDLSEKTRTMVELNALDENVPISLPERLCEIVDAQTRSYPDAKIESAISSDESVTVLDGTQFETAVTNVLENAITHNDTSSPWVRVSMTVVAEEVEISIEDDGPGIPPDERAVLEEGRETPLEHGSGIGLWLVHWCVRSVGGSISLQDREPTGSNVTLTFPVQTK